VHPSASIIVFTTLTGAGYGLLFWLGAAAALGLLPDRSGFAAATLGLAFAAVTAGLCSSLLHLGRPERAWRALSQWRSSWLSREGVAALATYPLGLLFAWGWIVRGGDGEPWGTLCALGAAATVVCTAHIYRSLKPIAQWHTGWVPANFLALAAMTGALWLAAFCAAFDVAAREPYALALAATAIACALKLLYWRHIDRHPGTTTAESATGLGRFGKVRLFQAPHTGSNYLMQEMGFAIARKHRDKLRLIALQLAFTAPLLLTLLALFEGGPMRVAAALLAALLAMGGVLIERWLFFAEATHTVTLYYGAASA
jgi:sulfite dehydrogenase (quinone) subunit SoeC